MGWWRGFKERKKIQHFGEVLLVGVELKCFLEVQFGGGCDGMWKITLIPCFHKEMFIDLFLYVIILSFDLFTSFSCYLRHAGGGISPFTSP